MTSLKDIDWRSQIFPRRDDLPRDLTTIDYLKTVAVTLMIIDHVGWLLFPQIEWFRVLGRMCVPLWFFLIGFSDRREIPGRWFTAGVILLVSNLVVGLPALPLSVLFTMALIRLIIDPFWDWLVARPIYFWWIILLLIFFSYASDMIVEYGTMGLLLASLGLVIRHREAVGSRMDYDLPSILMIVVLGAFGVLETLKFGFSMMAMMVLAAGLVGIYFVLQSFEAKTLPGTAAHPQAPLIRFMGRYTLEIYVIHLLILKAVFGLQMLAARIVG